MSFITAKDARKTYSISSSTLRHWSEHGKLPCKRMPGGKRLYDKECLRKLLGGDTDEKQEETKLRKRTGVCYARVSSKAQKSDLERQVADLRKKYPSYEIIQDIGSRVNWRRPGFTSLLESIYEGKIETVVVMHRDRLARFGIELVQWIMQKHCTKLVVQSTADEIGEENNNKELADDMLSIVNVFVARNNGRRSAANRKRRRGSDQESAHSGSHEILSESNTIANG
jgi:predicted site-specific integrase-resolvase